MLVAAARHKPSKAPFTGAFLFWAALLVALGPAPGAAQARGPADTPPAWVGVVIDGDTLVLTDMFGGTPTNLSLPYLSEKVEIVTGVNLPMIIKASTLREGALVEVARAVREQGKGAIYVASEVLARRPA